MKLTRSDYKEQKIGFLGKRSDKNLVNELTQESGALFKPKQRAISEAITRLGMDSSGENINFLFSVAENLNYGMKKDSELSNFVNKNSYVTNVVKKQNNEWEEKLKKALTSSISMNKTPESIEFKRRFDELFGEKKNEKDEKGGKTEKSVVNNPLTTRIQQEKELVSLRNAILNSEVLKGVPESFDGKQKAELGVDKKKLQRNIDYFIASSEVANGEKIECLKVVNHMASSDYKINPALKDYKAKILSEILVDLVTEQPNQGRLTSKEVAQRTHGMCAAISISRKAIPQEHKLAFATMIAAELDENPDMEVYNVTSKDLGEKVRVKKADIDYKQALKEEYRITDAAVTNWMHVANTYGDGTCSYGQYKAFDGENYGMFRDSHLTNDLEGVDKSKQYTLRALIKLQQKGEEVENVLKGQKIAALEKRTVDEDFVATSKLTHDNTESIVKELSGVSDQEAREVAKNILSDSYLQQIRKPFVSQYTDSEVKENAKAILTQVVDCKDNPALDKLAKRYVLNYAELNNAKAAKHNNDKKMDMFSNENMTKIFDFAAYTRVKAEFELDIPEKLAEQAKKLGIETSSNDDELKVKVLKKMENTGLVMKREDLDKIKGKIIEKTNLERKGRQNSDRRAQKAASEVVLFTPAQKEALKKVVKNFGQTQREVKKEYTEYQKDLAPKLEELYAESKYGGNFWAREEGSSGLLLTQQLRLIEQISGKEHYPEKDASVVMDNIEKAKGGSILASSVSDTDAAFHCQYVYDVDARNVKNSKTDQSEIQRVMFTDNSWGSMEYGTSYKKEVGRTFWTDSEGNTRTDYGRSIGGEFGSKGGFGYKHGFVVDKNYTIGVSEQDMLSGHTVFNHSANGKSEILSYPLFKEVITRGNSGSRSDLQSVSVQKSLFSALNQRSVHEINGLIENIKNGNAGEISDLKLGLNKSVASKIQSHSEKTGEALKSAIKKDISEVVYSYPSNIFKPEGKEKIANPEKFINELAKNLSSVVEEANASGKDKVQIECEIANKAFAVIKEVVSKNTTPIYVPNTNKSGAVQEKAKIEFDEFINKFRLSGDAAINTKEKFDALAEDGKTKLTLKKAALFEAVGKMEAEIISENIKIANAVGIQNMEVVSELGEWQTQSYDGKIKGLSLKDLTSAADRLLTAQNSSDLESVKKDFRMVVEKKLLIAFDKNLIEKMGKTPTTLAGLKDIPSGQKAIEFIDKKYNPSSDQECFEIYQKILDMPKEQQEKLVGNSKDSEIGHREPDYFNFAQRLNGKNESAETSAWASVVYSALAKEYNLKSPLKDGNHPADKLFISLLNTMGYAGIGQILKMNKTSVFNRFHAYVAMPIPVPFTESQLEADNKDMLDQLKEVAVKISDYKNGKGFEKGTDLNAVNEEIQHEKKVLSERTKIILNSCIQPKYIDEVAGKMNNYFSALANDPDSQKTKESEEKLLALMAERHITKNPEKLFESFVQDIAEENDYGSSDARENVIQLKSVYLTKICNAADKTKLEFDLISATQKGQMNSIARDFKDPKFGISIKGKKEALPWNSSKGIELLVAQLKDENSGHSALKHFLMATGMVNDAVNMITHGPSPAKFLQRAGEIKTILENSLEEQNQISDNYSDWKDSNKLTDAQKNSKDIYEVKELVNKYLEDIKPLNPAAKGSSYVEYKNMMRERLEMNDYMGIRPTTMDFIKESHEEFMSKQDNAKEDAIERIIGHQNKLNDNISMLNVISSMLKTEDQKKEEVGQYLTSASDVVVELEKIKDVFQQGILDKIIEKSKAEKAQENSQKLSSASVHSASQSSEKVSLSSEDNKADAEKLFDDLMRAQKGGDKLEIQLVLHGILTSKNPEMTKLLVKNLNDQSALPIVRAYSVRCLIEKKEFGALKEYLSPRLETGDDSKLDDVAVNCVDGMVVASILKEGDEKKEYLDLISKAFEISCDKNCQSNEVYALLGQLRNSLSNKSPEINNMLLDYAFDKNAGENIRAISMEILSRASLATFKPFMEDVVLNPKKYANNSSEEFTFFDVALLGLKNARFFNAEVDDKVKDALKKMDISAIVEKGMPGAPLEAKAAKEDDFKQRIEYIFCDNAAKKFLDEKGSREQKQQNVSDKKAFDGSSRMDSMANYIKYNNGYSLIR